MFRKALIVSTLLVAGIAPAFADPFEWIYGMSNKKATKKLEKQGFTFDRASEREGSERYFWWHRKSYCVKFRSVDDVVADADEVSKDECKGD